MDDSKETTFSKHSRTDERVNTEILVASAHTETVAPCPESAQFKPDKGRLTTISYP